MSSNSSIYITGSSGFIGNNIVSFYKKKFRLNFFKRNSNIEINEDVVLHLAGKAHDLNSTSNYNEYYEANTELTKQIFDSFLISNAKVFIMLSSVKAATDCLPDTLHETHTCNPKTHYGKSKLLAEQYILSCKIPNKKRVYILRPCMIHGPGNKGNLNLLYNFVRSRIPWPLGAYDNKRSYCCIDNLFFVINHLIINRDISSGIYNIADDNPLSTNEVISLIYKSLDRQPKILNISKRLIFFIAEIGNIIKLPLNSERLNKLTESYVVSNRKIINAIGKPMPISSKEGLLKTFKTFNI